MYHTFGQECDEDFVERVVIPGNDRLRLEQHDSDIRNERHVFPEIIALLYFITMVMQYTILEFWYFDHFSAKYGQPMNDDIGQPMSNDIGQPMSNDMNGYGTQVANGNVGHVEDKIQGSANRLNLYANLVSNFVAVFATFFLGPLSDRYGRRFIFFVSFCGLLVAQTVNILVFYYHFSPYITIIGMFLCGLSGNYGLFLVAAFALAADVTQSANSRMIRFSTLEATIAIGRSVGMTVSGVLLKHFGYVSTSVLILAIVAMAIMITWLCIPNTVPQTQPGFFSFCSGTRRFWLCIKKLTNGRCSILLVSLLSSQIHLFCLIGCSSISTLFLLHRPFCWTKSNITLFSGVRILGQWIVVLVVIFATKNCLPYSLSGTIASASATVGYLGWAFASNNTVIFIGETFSSLLFLLFTDSL